MTRTIDARRRLVIVESPAKAKTIAGLLGRGYVVESSFGHIRDLPSKKTDVPAAQRERFGDPVGVDVEGGFEPLYVVPPGRAKEQVRKLKAALKDADELLLATDEDREGEAIAWHLREELRPKIPVHRMVFHEITADAIHEAVDHPRDIDEDLVDAQETRRIVDRLYGYEVSPVLWRKVMQGLSAGRVQSVATRLVVDRERERMAFRSAEYWDLKATLDTGTAEEPSSFEARLTSLAGARVASGRDFDSNGRLRDGSSSMVVLSDARAHGLAQALRGRSVRGAVDRGEAVPPQSLRAIPDDDDAAGSGSQTGLRSGSHDAGRSAPLRGWVHHLYADRLDHVVRRGGRGGPYASG